MHTFSFRLWLCILILGTAFLTSSNVSAESGDDQCAQTVIGLMQNNQVDTSTFAPLFGCRQDANGTWRMVTVGDLSSPDLAEKWSNSVTQLHEQAISFAFSQQISPTLIYDWRYATVTLPGDGAKPRVEDMSSEWLLDGPNWLKAYQSSYANAAVLYFQTSGFSDFASYVQWYMVQRDATLSIITQFLNPMLRTAYLANWGFSQVPWPWQLANPLSIAAYLSSVGRPVEQTPLHAATPATGKTQRPQRAKTRQVSGVIEIQHGFSATNTGISCKSQFYYSGMTVYLYNSQLERVGATQLAEGIVTSSLEVPGTEACQIPFSFGRVVEEPVYVFATDLSDPHGWQISTLCPPAPGEYKVAVFIR